jgi:hypothetical protein
MTEPASANIQRKSVERFRLASWTAIAADSKSVGDAEVSILWGFLEGSSTHVKTAV